MDANDETESILYVLLRSEMYEIEYTSKGIQVAKMRHELKFQNDYFGNETALK